MRDGNSNVFVPRNTRAYVPVGTDEPLLVNDVAGSDQIILDLLKVFHERFSYRSQVC